MEAIDIINAINSIAPNANPLFDYQISVNEEGNYYFSKWSDHLGDVPDISDIIELATQLGVEREANAYKELRRPEYPPMEDYLDGIVKGDQAQIQEYIDACLAVKAKYPKP